MKIRHIAAINARTNIIGLNGQIPWHIPHDLKRFKALTQGCTLLVGRKTRESMPKNLPGRDVVVIGQGPDNYPSLEAALVRCAELGKDVWVAGGARVYTETLHLAQELWLTIVEGDFEGDTFYPELDPNVWRIKEHIEDVQVWVKR